MDLDVMMDLDADIKTTDELLDIQDEAIDNAGTITLTGKGTFKKQLKNDAGTLIISGADGNTVDSIQP